MMRIVCRRSRAPIVVLGLLSLLLVGESAWGAIAIRRDRLNRSNDCEYDSCQPPHCQRSQAVSCSLLSSPPTKIERKPQESRRTNMVCRGVLLMLEGTRSSSAA
jgi:hypothetical protein